MEEPGRRLFSFLSLPRELRDEIYSLHNQHVLHFTVVKHGYIISPSNLQLVCRQVHKEFSDTLPKLALLADGKTTVVKLVDFDFKSMIATINWLLKTSQRIHVGEIGRNPGYLVVQLFISQTWSRYPHFDGLKKWQKLVRESIDREVGFIVQYEVIEVEDILGTAMAINELPTSGDLGTELSNIGVEIETFTKSKMMHTKEEEARLEEADYEESLRLQ